MDRKGIMDRYAAALEARGCKESTIRTKTGQANALLERLQRAGMTSDPRHIGEREIRAVAKADGLKESTAYVYVNILTDLCEVCGNTRPRKVRILWNKTVPDVTWLNAADLRRLLKIAPPTERIILVLGAMAGLRVSEMVKLKIGDIHEGTVTVIGKGHGKGKIAEQPIPAEVRAELDRYLRWRSRQGVRTRDLILWPGGRMYSEDSGRVIIHRRLQELGDLLGVDITPHSLRRLYATTLVGNGIDIVTVSRLLRHSSAEVTMRYIARDRTREYEAIGTLAGVFEV